MAFEIGRMVRVPGGKARCGRGKEGKQEGGRGVLSLRWAD